MLIALALILLGAAAATWGLARYQSAARVLGVEPAPARQAHGVAQPEQQPVAPAAPPAGLEAAVSDLQLRLQRVENAAAQAQGSAGRADALLVAFAARRSIDRGVGLGYLEPLLLDRFGARHPQATATIVTTSRSPVRLPDLISDYEALRPALLAAAPQEGLWTSLKREFGSLIHVHRADRPSTQPRARYERALAQLSAGQVDAALAETMRLPGAPRANAWIAKARQYVAAHRALDEVESAALLGNSAAR
ncbi:MAG: hypothetical protein M3428_06150 [Pseudomonadota bacterium]|nr:hypothetical protein [Pseudomonadota bacterium]